jgi:hypothetical protein
LKFEELEPPLAENQRSSIDRMRSHAALRSLAMQRWARKASGVREFRAAVADVGRLRG